MNQGSPSPLTGNERTAIDEYLERVHRQFGEQILSVTLFGSKARGDSDAESDIDLLVLVKQESWELRSALWRIASDVGLMYTLVISVRVFARERWAETRRLRLPLYRAIAADGVPLSYGSAPARAVVG